MRQLGRAVGLQAQSIYAYFDSKLALYDAMFRDGYQRLRDEISRFPRDPGPDPRATLKTVMREWSSVVVRDPVRYQLLFQRPIADFEPSEESYAVALEVYDSLVTLFRALGVTDPSALDLWTAISSGITSQQLANDPGGDRWLRLTDDAVDMFFDHLGL